MRELHCDEVSALRLSTMLAQTSGGAEIIAFGHSTRQPCLLLVLHNLSWELNQGLWGINMIWHPVNIEQCKWLVEVMYTRGGLVVKKANNSRSSHCPSCVWSSSSGTIWQTALACRTSDWAAPDIPVMILHVFHCHTDDTSYCSHRSSERFRKTDELIESF